MRKFTLSVALALGCTYSTSAQIPSLLQSKLIDTQKNKDSRQRSQRLMEAITRNSLYAQ